MLAKKMEKALVRHINEELHSAYIYMSMSAHSSSTGLKGFSTWFMAQYHEEMMHAMKMYEYVQSQGGEIILTAIEEPPRGFKSALDMVQQTLDHERYMTKNINDLLEMAIEERDHATQIFLHWYVTEQVEEEDTVGEILARLKLIGDDPNALLMLDKEMGGRAVTVPTDFSQGIQGALKGA
ncbi:MAG: ferritin [Deltaproteobacteria bacterium]|nr:ferritin [Deltaproteobacteria bacterium]